MLDAIQEQLENIYGLRCEYRASDFVVDADSARKLGGSARAREELLVSEGEDGLELALYLHPSLTKPNLVITPHRQAELTGAGTGHVDNAEEI